MSWSEPIDETRFRHLRNLLTALASYFLFRTRRLIDLSEWSTFLTRLSLTIALFIIASASTILASTYFYPDNIGPLDFIIWSGPAIFILAILLVIPALLGYRIIKVRRFYFVANVILIQQALLGLAVIGAHAVLVRSEPARTDFSMLWDGTGQRTVAFQRYCGGLEISAEIAELTQRAQNRSAAVLNDLKLIHSWGTPTPESAALHMPELQAQFRNRVRELDELERDMDRQRVLVTQRVQAIEAFAAAYPTYFEAERSFQIGFLLIALWSTVHLARAAMLGDRGRKFVAVAVFGVLMAWGISAGFAWSALSSAGFPLYSDVETRPLREVIDEDRRRGSGEMIRTYEREYSRLKAEFEDDRRQLRADLYRMRHICPTINTRGLT